MASSSDNKYYVHVGFQLDRIELIEKLKDHITDEDDVKNAVIIAEMYFTEHNQLFMDNFYKKYLDNTK